MLRLGPLAASPRSQPDPSAAPSTTTPWLSSSCPSGGYSYSPPPVRLCQQHHLALLVDHSTRASFPQNPSAPGQTGLSGPVGRHEGQPVLAGDPWGSSKPAGEIQNPAGSSRRPRYNRRRLGRLLRGRPPRQLSRRPQCSRKPSPLRLSVVAAAAPQQRQHQPERAPRRHVGERAAACWCRCTTAALRGRRCTTAAQRSSVQGKTSTAGSSRAV